MKTPWGGLTDVSELWSGGRLFEPGEIKVSALIVGGEWDSYWNDPDAKSLFHSLKQLPVKRDLNIARATHFTHFEENRFDLYEETRAFLRGEKARTRARLHRLNISLSAAVRICIKATGLKLPIIRPAPATRSYQGCCLVQGQSRPHPSGGRERRGRP